MELPEDLRYDGNHLWVREEGGTFTIGWTEFAVVSAGDVSYLSLPKKGDRVEAGKDFGSIETGKWVGRLASPFTGEIVDVNARLLEDPGLLNEAPFGDGWMIKVSSKDGPKQRLLGPEEYKRFMEAGRAF